VTRKLSVITLPFRAPYTAGVGLIPLVGEGLSTIDGTAPSNPSIYNSN
jgi:hypothetical protein